MNRNQFDKTEREPVTRAEFEEALKQILASDAPERPTSENREPTKAELEKRWKLVRRR